ncbi:MAG: hypothetical protein RL156_277 [Bacteroidota bacterium]
MRPSPKIHVRVCTNVSCVLRGGDDVFDSLCRHVKCDDPAVAKSRGVVVERTTCLGHCTHAPVVAVNDDLYEDVSVDDLPDLYKEIGL